MRKALLADDDFLVRSYLKMLSSWEKAGFEITADVRDGEEALEVLDREKIDLVVTDMPTAMAACAAYPDMKLLDFSGTDDDFSVSDEEVNIGISVQKGNTELIDGINSVLETMTVDDFNSLMQEAISVQPLAE